MALHAGRGCAHGGQCGGGVVWVEGLATSPLSVEGHFCERAAVFQCSPCCVLSLQGETPWDDKDLRSLAMLGAGVAAGFLYFYFRDPGKEITWKHFVQYYLARGLVRGFACCRPWKEVACWPRGADVTTLLHPHTCPLPETLVPLCVSSGFSFHLVLFVNLDTSVVNLTRSLSP